MHMVWLILSHAMACGTIASGKNLSAAPCGYVNQADSTCHLKKITCKCN